VITERALVPLAAAPCPAEVAGHFSLWTARVPLPAHRARLPGALRWAPGDSALARLYTSELLLVVAKEILDLSLFRSF
jgi:hypothetical protein